MDETTQKAAADFPRTALEDSLGRRFEGIAGRYPERVAVRTRDAVVNYDSLNRAVNRIAHWLLSQPIPSGEPVAMLLPTGLEVVQALLGILKAGKIAVPLDPTYPQERLSMIVAEAGARVILTLPEFEGMARELAGADATVVNVGALPADLPDHDPVAETEPDALAYLLFSSGSTGRPKGIVHTHRNVLQNIRSYSLAFGILPEDRLTQLHSVSFSSAMIDIFSSLLNGASVFPWDVKLQGLEPLGRWLATEGITIFNWSPTTYRHLMETLPAAERLPAVRLVVLGSEPVTRIDWELYCRHFTPGCRFVNRLGTTEVNNFRLQFLDQRSEVPSGTLPGGYAVEDKEVIILDEAERPVAAGEIGQIAVRSRYLSPGYWKRPDLTAAAFRPDPDGGDRRIYLTGDVGRVRADGCLEHLGRKDSQIKFHGVRIEAAEIELALTTHPAVRDALVLVHTDGAGHQFLVAYLVARSKPVPPSVDLQRMLRAKLPPAMVPSAYQFLDAFPLTPSGKVDRRALAAPVVESADYVAPVSETEQSIASLWSDLLHISRVGRGDDFFNLGGQSLTAVQMLARLSQARKVEVPLRLLFEAPRLQEFAAQVDVIARIQSRPDHESEFAPREEGVL